MIMWNSYIAVRFTYRYVGSPFDKNIFTTPKIIYKYREKLPYVCMYINMEW